MRIRYADVHTALEHVESVANEVEVLLFGNPIDYSFTQIEGDWQACFRPALFPLGIDVFSRPPHGGFM